jgi:hypothetical protein
MEIHASTGNGLDLCISQPGSGYPAFKRIPNGPGRVRVVRGLRYCLSIEWITLDVRCVKV